MLHIQIVLYNSSRFLDNLILGFNEVKKYGSDFTVHFIENSDSTTLEQIQDLKPTFNFTFDKANENLGFGKGHNKLFKKYNNIYEEYFLILNPDVIPFFNFISQFKKFIETKSKWSVIELAQFPKEHPKDYDNNFETEWAHGASSIFKVEDFKNVNGFDENIFMYCEDVDISWRIKELGGKIFYLPQSKICHITQELDSNKSNTFERIYSFAGGMYLRHKYFGEKKLEDYKKIIRGAGEDYEKALEIFEKMKTKLEEKELEFYRKFNTPTLYQNTNYAKHRW